MAGMIRISPKVHTARMIHSVQATHPRLFVSDSVTPWTVTLALWHFGQRTWFFCSARLMGWADAYCWPETYGEDGGTGTSTGFVCSVHAVPSWYLI